MEIRRIDRLGLGRSSLPSLVTRKRRVLDEACFRALTRQLPHRVVIKDTNSAFLSCNEAAARDLGLLPRDLIGKSDCDVFPAEIAERHRAEDLWVMQEGQISSFEALGVRNGESVWLHTTKTPIYDDAGALTGLMVVSEDITEKKREADELKRRGRALQALHGAHQALVHAESEMALLQGGCEAIALEAMYSLVWIGWASDDPERSVRLVAAAGKAVAFTDGLEVSWGDGPFGGGPRARRSSLTKPRRRRAASPGGNAQNASVSAL